MLHTLLNLPQMPQEYIDHILEIIKDDKNIAYATATIGPRAGQVLPLRVDHGNIRYHDGSFRKSAVYKRFEVPEYIHQWLVENVDPNITNPKPMPGNEGKMLIGKLGIQVFEHHTPGEFLTYAPHADGPRGHYVLNYIIATGGNNVVTRWWQHGNDSLTRPENGAGLYLKSHDNLSLVEETVFPERAWSLIDARVLHSIDNLESPRVSISIGYTVDDSPWKL